ncbi:Rho GTPase activation protein [Obelidium mucronatum]|nr:Rho GTPase activation protein [Obelidium mucronatum]
MKQLFRRISNIGSRSNGSHGTANSMFGHSIDQMLVKDHVTSGSQHHHQNDHHHHHHKQRAGASSINVASMTIVGSAESLEKEVPVVLKNFVEYLSSKEAVTMEGLFRVAAPVKQVKELRESMEKTGSMEFSKLDPYDGIHIVASVFKQWIRDIPDGVVPRKYFQQLLDCGASAAKLRDVVRSMPQPNRDFLEYLMKYLLKLVSYSSKNLMTVQNLVIVFAPNLFKCPSAPSPSSPNGNPEKYLVESMQVTKIMANIMENFHEIFQVW